MAYTTIDDPSAYFQTATYTGTSDDSAKVVTNDGNSDLQPDLLWIKARSGTYSDRDHALYDSSRGATKRLESSTTDTEATDSGNSFSSDGFTLTANYTINGPGTEYVGWQWKANGGTTSSNTDGNVTVTLQANTTAGFSIGTWTSNGGTSGTIGHGLGARPDIVITKERDDTGNWNVIVPDYASNQMGFLQSTNAFGVASGINTVGSSTFTDGDGADSNDRVFYAFRSIQGYSKIGQYKGNGDADGTFVYTGFKPAFLIAKEAGATRNWTMAASKLQTAGNGTNTNSFQPNIAGAQDANERMDWLSNGFKLRTISTTWNTDNGTFIYAAFAKNPFVTSGGVPCTAR